jgi:hypothetical protein
MQHARQRRMDPFRIITCTTLNSMSPLDLWVHRDNKQLAHGGSCLRALERSLAQITRLRDATTRRRAALDALIVAGELEAALGDAADPLERTVGETTDALASVVLGEHVDLAVCAEGLAHTRAPRSLSIRPQSGFAYGALHPEAYATASRRIDARHVLVVGIDDAGTTLAAITRASLKARGARVERVTLRHSGPIKGSNIARAIAPLLRLIREVDAAVVIVDEKPSDSDLSILTVGEAFVLSGIARERIYFLVGEPGAPGRFRSERGAERWQAFRTVIAESSRFGPIRSGVAGSRDLSRGNWRQMHFTKGDDWPAVVEGFERRKIFRGGRLFKFEGLGSSGLAARHRASALAAEGIALDPSDEGDGWTSYAWGGRPLEKTDLDVDLVDHMARYCARRPTLCPLTSAESDLETAVATNVAALTGKTRSIRLEIVRVATTDARFAPHEWLCLDDRSLRKTDAIAHGDDRFFPGPTDIAWDLAGAIVEWEMDRHTREHFLTAYRRASGDDAEGRIEAWIVAYLSIRSAFMVHAAAQASSTEAPRLLRKLERYRLRLDAALGP